MGHYNLMIPTTGNVKYRALVAGYLKKTNRCQHVGGD